MSKTRRLPDHLRSVRLLSGGSGKRMTRSLQQNAAEPGGLPLCKRSRWYKRVGNTVQDLEPLTCSTQERRTCWALIRMYLLYTCVYLSHLPYFPHLGFATYSGLICQAPTFDFLGAFSRVQTGMEKMGGAFGGVDTRFSLTRTNKKSRETFYYKFEPHRKRRLQTAQNLSVQALHTLNQSRPNGSPKLSELLPERDWSENASRTENAHRSAIAAAVYARDWRKHDCECRAKLINPSEQRRQNGVALLGFQHFRAIWGPT